MIRCDQCSYGYAEGKSKCPRCGSTNATAEPDNMDQLIQQASVPNLASLFRKAKEAGVIGAVSVYGEGSTT